MYPTYVLSTPPPSSPHPPNPLTPLSLPSPLRPSTRHQTLDPRSFGEAINGLPHISQPDQDEALCPAKHGPQVQYSVMEEEHDEHDGNPTSSNPPPQPDKTKGDRHREPKAPSSKQFPYKLFRMLDDETITNYVTWSKSESLNALYIPDIKAFEVNVMPKYFKDMKQWGSFQRQLLNYGFQKQDRGTGKAIYIHSDNKFHKGCPDLLLRITNKKKKAFIGQDSTPTQARPTTPIGATSPQSEGQIDLDTEEQLEQLEHENERLKKTIVELKDELECSKARHSAAEDRLQATEERLLVVENQLRKPDWFSTGYGALNPQVHPGPAGAVLDDGFPFDALPIPAAASGFPSYQNSSSRSGPSESHLPMGIPYEPLDPSFILAHLQPEVYAHAATARQSPL